MQTAIDVQALRTSVRLGDQHTIGALARVHGPLLGLGDNDQPLAMTDHCEHLLVAAGAGAGTTTLLRALAAQSLSLGASVTFLDTARAHRWALGLPRATHLSRLEAIHDHLIAAATALPSVHVGGGWKQRTVFLTEQLGSLVQGLRQYWNLTRPESQLEESPAVEALTTLLAAGPGRGVQFIAGNPAGTVPGLLDESLSEVFPTRVISGSATLWARLAPTVWFVPPASCLAGRMHVVTDGAPVGMQTLQLTETEARQLAGGPAQKTKADKTQGR
ncbi:cell division protein FtsK [Streptomyces erythrochromogenes]|uniref:cell division protein FtsK n=1 Tax=Streptomyces erythrochromogenes TaxID=285574 RepID=UPI0034439CD1